jgi:flavodoxin
MITFLGNSMNRVIILYAPDIPELKQASDRLKKAFAAEDFHAETKPSKYSSIQDLAASDIILAGFRDAKKCTHPDFAEISRALSGINLAGRIAGAFAVDTDGIMNQFKKTFGDSDVTIHDEALSVDNRDGDVKQMNLWVKNIIAKYKEGLNARKV